MWTSKDKQLYQVVIPNNMSFWQMNRDLIVVGIASVPVLDANGNQIYDQYGGALYRNAPAQVIPASFSLRNVADVVNGWDDTYLMSDQRTIDPKQVPWTVVGVGQSNNLVQLNLPNNAQNLNLELVVEDGSTSGSVNATGYISLSNNTINGPVTTFTITGKTTNVTYGTDKSIPPIQPADVVLRVKATTSTKALPLLRIHVAVLEPKNQAVDVLFAYDRTNAGSALPASKPTGQQVVNWLNSVLSSQTLINFYLGFEGTYDTSISVPGGLKVFDANGALDYYDNQQSAGETALENLDAKFAPFAPHIAVLVVNSLHDVTTPPDPLGIHDPNTIYSFITAASGKFVFSHEVGHQLGLAVRNYHNMHDKDPWPIEFQKITTSSQPIKRGLMWETDGFACGWLRVWDWCKASDSVH
jgi:hypothetical protein